MKNTKTTINTINKITSISYILYIVMIGGAGFFVWTWTPYWWSILLIGSIGLVVGGIPLYLYNRHMKQFFHAMNGCMDEMLNMPASIAFPESVDPETIMARFQTKLERIYLLIKETEDKTRQENEKLHSLISDISHQTKTPLTNLKMYFTILADENLSIQERKEFQAISETQTEKLEFLIQSLIKLSRLETGVFLLDAKLCNFYQTLANAVGGILLEAEKKTLDVEVKCPETLLIKHDRKWTEEALFNLLENAVKYTPINGKIKIFAEEWESYIKIDICDNGIGIAEEQQGKIFQRFYRTPEVSQHKGAGIGLYITREIIERQQGYITVKSSKQKGSSFSVFLPN